MPPVTDDAYARFANGFTWEAWFNLRVIPAGSLFGAALPILSGTESAGPDIGCVHITLGFGSDRTAMSDLSFVHDRSACGGFATSASIASHTVQGLQTGTWHHIAGSADASGLTLTLYLDGAQIASGKYDPGSSFAAPANASFEIGRQEKAYFYGTIDEVRVYDTALSAAQILAHWNNGVEQRGSSSEFGIVAGWHFDESSGTAIDYTVTGHDGTLQGGAQRVPRQ